MSIRTGAVMWLLFEVAAAACLDDALPGTTRLVSPDGIPFDLTMATGNWDASIIGSEIARIILEEGAGLVVKRNLVGGSGAALEMIIGCADPACDTVHDIPEGHLDFESWYTEAGEAVRLRYAERVATGFIGYDGQEGLYMREELAERVWNESQLPVDWYRTLSRDSREPWMRHFASTQDIEIPADSGCRGATADTLLAKAGLECDGDGWFYPEGHREHKEECIPTLMGGIGWLGIETAKVVAYLDLPIAVSYLGWPDSRVQNQEVDALFFWWRPDWTYNGVGVTRRLQFPLHDRLEWAANIHKTDFPDFQLQKHASTILRQASPVTWKLFEAISISLDEMNAMMDIMHAELGGGRVSPIGDSMAVKTWVACEYVKANEQRWRGWLLQCPDGQVGRYDAELEQEVCIICSAGTYCPHGASFEAPCEPGHYCLAESTLPTPCPVGTHRIKYGGDAASACLPCEAGTFAESPGTAVCAPCRGGTFPSPSHAACTPCPVGTYHDEDEMDGPAASCTRCPDTFTTMTMGSASAASCTCPAETFWNRRDDVCDPCPAESYCPGGLHLPVVYEGSYGKYIGSVASREAEEQAKMNNTYTPDSRSFYKMEVYKCSGASRCPGETRTFDMSDYNVDAASVDFVRVGFPLDGACPVSGDPLKARVGIACDRCQDGYYGTGPECVECGAGGGAGSIILCLIMPFVMICIYRATTSSGTQRVQAAFVLVSTCGMVSFFMQTIAVLDTFSFSWPEELGWLFELSRIFMFDLQGLSLSCFHGEGFAGKYWTTILVPIFIILVTVVGFLITKALPVPGEWKMMPAQTFSLLGMLLSALYITLVKVTEEPVRNGVLCPPGAPAPHPALHLSPPVLSSLFATEATRQELTPCSP